MTNSRFIEVQDHAGNNVFINTVHVDAVTVRSRRGDGTLLDAEIMFASGSRLSVIVDDEGYGQLRQLVEPQTTTP